MSNGYTAEDMGLDYEGLMDYYQQNWFNIAMSQAETAVSAMNPISAAGLNPYDPTAEQNVWSTLGLDLLQSEIREDSIQGEAYANIYETGRTLSSAGIKGNRAVAARNALYNSARSAALEERRTQDKLINTASSSVQNIHQQYLNQVGDAYANWMAADPSLSGEGYFGGVDPESDLEGEPLEEGQAWNLFMATLGEDSEAANQLIDYGYSWATGQLDPNLQAEYDYFVENYVIGDEQAAPEDVAEYITPDMWLFGQMAEQYYDIYGASAGEATQFDAPYSFGQFMEQMGVSMTGEGFVNTYDFMSDAYLTGDGTFDYGDDFITGWAETFGADSSWTGFGAASEHVADFGQYDDWSFYGFDYSPNPDFTAGTWGVPTPSMGGTGGGISPGMSLNPSFVQGEELDILYG